MALQSKFSGHNFCDILWPFLWNYGTKEKTAIGFTILPVDYINILSNCKNRISRWYLWLLRTWEVYYFNGTIEGQITIVVPIIVFYPWKSAIETNILSYTRSGTRIQDFLTSTFPNSYVGMSAHVTKILSRDKTD